MRREVPYVPLAIALIVLTAAAIVLPNVEWRTEEVFVGVSEEAQNDPYHAVRRWTSEAGLRFDSTTDESFILYGLPIGSVSPASVIVRSTDRLAAVAQQDLIAWLEAGGTLTIVFHEPFFTEERSDIALWERVLDRVDAGVDRSGRDGSTALLPLAEIVRSAPFERADGTAWQVAYTPPSGVLFRAGERADVFGGIPSPVGDSDEPTYRLLILNVGSGRVILSGDPRFLQNDWIGEDDNADLAWLLLGEGRGSVTFRIGTPPPVRLSDLVRFWWTLPIAALLFVVAVAWRSLTRANPVLATGVDVGIDISVRLEREARFLWRHRAVHRYLERAQERALAHIRLRGYMDATGEPDRDRIGLAINESSQQIDAACEAAPEKLRRQEFLNLIRVYAEIEEKL